MKQLLIPRHLGNIRNFRTKKRQQFKSVMKAFEDFRFGCAYTPAYDSGAIERFETAMKEIKEQISSREWKSGYKPRPSSRA